MANRTLFVREIGQKMEIEPRPTLTVIPNEVTMPRYYFTVLDGQQSKLKNEGLDLPDKQSAWVEATTACGELLRDLDGRLNPGDAWSMQVKDDAGAELYLLEFKTRAF
jgi:hypothetical protein